MKKTLFPISNSFTHEFLGENLSIFQFPSHYVAVLLSTSSKCRLQINVIFSAPKVCLLISDGQKLVHRLRNWAMNGGNKLEVNNTRRPITILTHLLYSPTKAMILWFGETFLSRPIGNDAACFHRAATKASVPYSYLVYNEPILVSSIQYAQYT